jgi:transcriptional regulator with XRE-family HTH domain
MAAEPAFGELLRRRREHAGLSQYELAQRCDMRAESIGRLERGGRNPRLSTIARLARGIGITPPS